MRQEVNFCERTSVAKQTNKLTGKILSRTI